LELPVGTLTRPAKNNAALAASHGRTPAEPRATEVTPMPGAAKKVQSRSRPKTATVSWYGSLLIVCALLVAAGWELFRLILAIIVMD